MRNNYFLFLGSVSFIFFALLSVLVQANIFKVFDFDTTVKIQDNLPDSLITFFSTFSLLGTVEIISIVFLVSMVIFPPLRKISVLILYSLTGIIEIVGKALIEQTGPPIAFLKTNLNMNFPSDHIPHEFFAYPSGHSARSAFVAVLIIAALIMTKKTNLLTKKILISVTSLMAFFMFLSRVYLGEHWTTDVIGGALLGFSLAMFASYLSFKRT